MIYNSEEGVFLFGFNKENDLSAIWDNWFVKVEYAIETLQEYGVDRNEWKEILDPIEGCQHDWIEPVRVRRVAFGKQSYGKLEKLVNGKWINL